MTDILAKVVIIILCLICVGGARYVLINGPVNTTKTIIAQEVEKVAEEVIVEETGFVLPPDKIDQSKP